MSNGGLNSWSTGSGLNSGSGYVRSKRTISNISSGGIPTGGDEKLNPNAIKYIKGRVSEKKFEELRSKYFPDNELPPDEVSKKDFPDSKCCDCCVIQ